MRIQRLIRAVSAIATLVALTSASDRAEVSGAWSGKIQGMLRLVLHVRRSGEGFSATLDSPDQSAMGMTIDTFALEGDSVRFEMRALSANFAGRMSDDGTTIVGEWRQAGL